MAFVCFGGHARVQGEAADLAGIAFQRAGIAGQCLQGDDFAPGLRAGGDAVGDRTHPQRVHAVAAASAVGQEDGLLLKGKTGHPVFCQRQNWTKAKLDTLFFAGPSPSGAFVTVGFLRTLHFLARQFPCHLTEQLTHRPKIALPTSSTGLNQHFRWHHAPIQGIARPLRQLLEETSQSTTIAVEKWVDDV